MERFTQDSNWWHKPLRIVQTNLQVRDTHLIDPEKLAVQLEDLGANALVFNVGGIYAWYSTEVPFHTKNEFLSSEFDLIESVIKACHKKNIRFIARFDFSRAADITYLQHPEWFVRKSNGEPLVIGGNRPGNWSLLMTTCANAGYRNEQVAVPVLEEFLNRYDIDGIFFNNTGQEPCHCAACQQKYLQIYGEALPVNSNDFHKDWHYLSMRDNMEVMFGAVKRVDPKVAMLFYYNPLYNEQMTDLLCTEPQNVLSLGHQQIPEFWKPALNLKLARSIPNKPAPIGIVHSCPGMDWRHTGLPPAEYLYWLSQVPGQGCSIWHSLTGVPDTITDKRILETVKVFNRMVMKIEDAMSGSTPYSQIALLWTLDKSAERWAEALFTKQISFDVLLHEKLSLEGLSLFRVLILPEGVIYDDNLLDVVTGFIKMGGHVIAEGTLPEEDRILSLAGVAKGMYRSGHLGASYIRFEPGAGMLQRNMEQTELIPHSGAVVYCRPKDSKTQVLATLVPPFSPVEGAGAPPERASLAVSHTDIPLAMRCNHGSGSFLYFPFQLSWLSNAYKLAEHFQMIENAIDMLLDGEKRLEITHYQGLQASLFRKENMVFIHLVNGAGRRPLTVNTPLVEINMKLKMEGKGTVRQVKLLISEQNLPFVESEGYISFNISRLDVWDCVRVQLSEEE